MSSKYDVERIGIGLLLCIALLMFESPLVRLHGPEGDLPGDGSNVRWGLTMLKTGLTAVAAYQSTPETAAAYRPVRTAPESAAPLELPFSLENSFYTPWLILASLVCAALALVDLLFSRKGFAGLCLLGGCLAALAVLHVTLMNSDLRTWTKALISTHAFGAADSPLLVTRMLMINSFQVSPGPGLYVLSSCLLLVPFISSTHSISRVGSVVRSDPRVKMTIPVLIRPVNTRYPEQMSTSLNVSKNGLQVESDASLYYAGMEVYLTRNAGIADLQGPEEHGCVVRVERPEGGKCRVAIRLISRA